MDKNLFENLRERKLKVLELATKAKDYGWVSSERFDEIHEKISNDILSIGVIGQMKCGKSTVLNAIVFEDDVLPAATTPMTAALSVITYGPEKKVKAEFYTSEEWEELKMQAGRSLVDGDGRPLIPLEESKIKAAKELVGKSKILGDAVNTLLGQTKEDSFDNLIEYVGADGKYVSITKSVTIYYPKEYLQGVEIVDTPGFNDPIVSREERTKAFLNKADVVLLMLYAGRPFDATDRDILFKNVHQCGIGKILIGINKYDIPYTDKKHPETEEAITAYVKEQISKASKECDDSLLVELLSETEPIPISAEMALLSELPMSKINSIEKYSVAWKRYCDGFEICGQPDMMTASHLDNLTEAIRKVIEREKVEILLRKPMSAIINAGKKKEVDIDKEIAECEYLIKTLSLPDDEILERKEMLVRADNKLTRKIDTLGDDIESELKNVVRKGKYTLEDDIDSACNELDRIIDGLKLFQNAESISPKMKTVLQRLLERTLKRNTEGIASSAKKVLKKCVDDFLDSAGDIWRKYAPDFETEDFLKSLKKLNFEIEDGDVFKYGQGDEDGEEGSWLDVVSGVIYCYLDVLSFGNLDRLVTAFNHKNIQNKLHEAVMEIRKTDVSEYTDSIMGSKDRIIESVKQEVKDKMLKPLQEQLDNVLSNLNNKESQLSETRAKLDRLQADKALIEQQLEEFK